MKKSILTFIVITLLTSCSGQATRSSEYLIQDTSYCIQTWPLNSVTDINTNKVYAFTEEVKAKQTLSSTIEKVEFNGNDFSTNTVSIGEFNPNRTCSSNSSSAFVSAFRSGKDIVFIPKGCYLIEDDIVIPYGKTIVFEKGAKLDITGSFLGNVTQIQSGENQIFTLGSNVTGIWRPYGGAAYVEWFGAKGDGTGTIDMAAFQKTLEVFCKPTQFTLANSTRDSTRANGNRVLAVGNRYIVEQTLEFPKYGNLKVGRSTVIEGSTADFYDSFVNVTEEPYYIEGGKWLVHPYYDFDGWPTSAQDQTARHTWAYNKNPVFRFYISEFNAITSNSGFGERPYRFASSCSNIELGYTGNATDWYMFNNNDDLAYDGFFITADTTTQTSGTLDLYRHYVISNYVAGDDFTNVADVSSGTINTTGCQFNAKATVPNTWTNGSSVRQRNSAVYFDNWHDIRIRKADTAFYMNGDTQGGMFNGWQFSNMMFDGCRAAIIQGDRAVGNIWNNLMIQTANSSFSDLPQITLNGSDMNYIDGMVWDVWNDSTILIKNAMGNVINMASADDELTWKFTKEVDVDKGYPNYIGPNSLFHRVGANWPKHAYWMNGSMLGVKDQDNESINIDQNPNGILHVTGRNGWGTELDHKYDHRNTPLFVQTERQDYGLEKIDTPDGMVQAIAVSQHVVSSNNNKLLHRGTGSSIRFYLSDTSAAGDDYRQFPIGILGFRQGGPKSGGTPVTKSLGMFQLWQKNDATWLNTMTIDPQGKMGLLGVYNPKYTLDLSAAGTLRSSNIIDDGTDVEIKSPLSINVLHFTPAKRPVKATVGDMYLSSEDGNLYFYTNTGWKTVVLK